MALSTYVVYDTTTGDLRCACVAANAPPFDAGQAVLVLAVMDPIPTLVTHRVDVSGPTLVTKTAQEQTDEANAQKKANIERMLADLDGIREKLVARGFSTTTIDAEISTLEVEHATLL